MKIHENNNKKGRRSAPFSISLWILVENVIPVGVNTGTGVEV